MKNTKIKQIFTKLYVQQIIKFKRIMNGTFLNALQFDIKIIHDTVYLIILEFLGENTD